MHDLTEVYKGWAGLGLEQATNRRGNKSSEI